MAIKGLYTDAITLVAEVIESKRKPSHPWGEIAQSAFASKPAVVQHGTTCRAILALGRQDTDPDGLLPVKGCTILGASSDHLVLDCGQTVQPVGSEVCFQLNYSALVRSMTSPFVAKVMVNPSRDHYEPMSIPAS
jgi:predicted amino acid racemase